MIRIDARLAASLAFLSLVLGTSTAGCGAIFPTPDDFPPPPGTVIVELPTPGPAPIATFLPQPVIRPITDADMQAARTFFLMIKTAAIAGDDQLIAERIRYPIVANIDGQRVPILSAADFSRNYSRIFDGRFVQSIAAADEEKLALLPDGIRVGTGQLWLNLYCMDPTCSHTQFFITQINN